MLKLFRYMKKRDIIALLGSFILILCQIWFELKIPDYMSEITRLVQMGDSGTKSIAAAGVWMILCAFGSLITAFITGLLISQVAAGLAMRLRAAVYDKVMAFSMEEMGKFSTASLITRSINDVTQIQTLVAMGMQAMIKAPFLAAWAVLKMIGKKWQWMAVTGGAVLLLVLMLSVILIYTVPKFTVIQKLTDYLNRVTRENLSGIRVIRAYNAENYQKNKFQKANAQLADTNLFTNRAMAFLNPGMMLIVSLLNLGIYWVGVYLIDAASMGERISLFSDMVVFTSYATQVVMAFMLLTMSFMILPRAFVSAGRISEVLETNSEIKDGTAEGSDLFEKGEVEFRHVGFRYPDAEEYVLKDISFTAHKGETIAFIGSTGSGKSTLINLLPRFYDVTEGCILVDGINIKDYKKDVLREKIGYVSQKPILFCGTIESNVTYGEWTRSEKDNGRLYSALWTAQAIEFVNELEEREQAQIAQGGVNLSGGQKQRLAIARAIYRNPEIYVFDDSFSALDYRTDKKLRKALKEQTSGITTFIVAQRIGTVMDADKIIVLDGGKIAGMGTHEELIKTCEIYKEIADSQLTREELQHGKS